MRSAVSETQVTATEHNKPWRWELCSKGHLDDSGPTGSRAGASATQAAELADTVSLSEVSLASLATKPGSSI